MFFVTRRSTALSLIACAGLGGCAMPGSGVLPAHLNTPAVVAQVTPAERDLIYLPPPPQPVPVAVYAFQDQTGQLKLSETTQSLSRAVTQGGTSILIGALRSAGNGNWFTVVEREHLDNLLRERQIIREMRHQYLNESVTPANILPSILFAGITLEGGIISYDTNVQTGGIGARFLGIGANTQYRTNTATVYLRAVSVKTGEVLANVVTQKSISSIGISAGVFKFVKYNDLLEAEAGTTTNEPGQLAIQSAIERAVYALVLEGAKPGPRQFWAFADQQAGNAWLARYAEEREHSLASAYQRAGPVPAARKEKKK